MKNLTLVKVSALLFTLFTATVVYRANTGQSLFIEGIHQIPMLDKICHLLFCGILALLLNLATKNKTVSIWNKKWLIVSLLLAVFFTIEEFSQMFISSRNFDLLDLLANYIGIGIASWSILRFRIFRFAF